MAVHRRLPFTRNSTLVTPTASLALAVRVVATPTVAVAGGLTNWTVGGVVSGGGRTLTEALAVAELPAASMAVASMVALPSASGVQAQV